MLGTNIADLHPPPAAWNPPDRRPPLKPEVHPHVSGHVESLPRKKHPKAENGCRILCRMKPIEPCQDVPDHSNHSRGWACTPLLNHGKCLSKYIIACASKHPDFQAQDRPRTSPALQCSLSQTRPDNHEVPLPPHRGFRRQRPHHLHPRGGGRHQLRPGQRRPNSLLQRPYRGCYFQLHGLQRRA